MVPTVGLEPTCYKRGILSALCIPIPPRGLINYFFFTRLFLVIIENNQKHPKNTPMKKSNNNTNVNDDELEPCTSASKPNPSTGALPPCIMPLFQPLYFKETHISMKLLFSI